jgi:hypothetical protein
MKIGAVLALQACGDAPTIPCRSAKGGANEPFEGAESNASDMDIVIRVALRQSPDKKAKAKSLPSGMAQSQARSLSDRDCCFEEKRGRDNLERDVVT